MYCPFFYFDGIDLEKIGEIDARQKKKRVQKPEKNG